jgi:alanine racemase
MDSLTVDLTDTPAQLGDSVCLWQSAAPPAAYAKTIPYELLTALSQRVQRVTR